MNHYHFLQHNKRANCRFIKNPKTVKSGAGFTIVEVLISTAIFIVVVVIIFAIYLTSQKFYQKTETKAEILQNARVVLERMVREVRQAQEIVTPLPQTPDNSAIEIEFQDGHSPSPYDYLLSNYYYIRYFVASSTKEVHRQYKVYCFDECLSCSEFFRWNDSKMEEGQPLLVHSCVLEDKVVGEYVNELKFWGAGVINISLALSKIQEQLDFTTSVFGRNL
ncbi:MAG: hypothetical protein PHW31_00630 [Candidatus Pacebacteria bacterium]|nr:hypothetical protein [Candidatus Paceibacterota bacterium]